MKEGWDMLKPSCIKSRNFVKDVKIFTLSFWHCDECCPIFYALLQPDSVCLHREICLFYIDFSHFLCLGRALKVDQQYVWCCAELGCLLSIQGQYWQSCSSKCYISLLIFCPWMICFKAAVHMYATFVCNSKYVSVITLWMQLTNISSK